MEELLDEVGALKFAYQTFRESIDSTATGVHDHDLPALGLHKDQLFFISYGQVSLVVGNDLIQIINLISFK